MTFYQSINYRQIKDFHLLVFLLPLLLTLSSCTGTLTNLLVEPALDNMQEQSDLELVCEGTPAYLLMIDSLIAGDPRSPAMLTIGAKAYGSYIGAMIECGRNKERVEAMAEKAYTYGTRLLRERFGISAEDNFVDFQEKLATADKGGSEELFWATFAWIVWVQQQEGAPAAMAHLGKIEYLLQKIIELDETIQNGAAHFLLGGYYGSRPVLLGGNPEKSRYHFDRALVLAKRRMLIFQATYAETYARATMNKELHDRLLHEVIDFPLQSYRQNMLANQIAKRRAVRLLNEKFFD